MRLKTISYTLIVILVLSACGSDKKTTSKSGSKSSSGSEKVSHRQLVHELYKNYPLKTESQWDSLHHFKVFRKKKSQVQKHQDYNVLGWHLYAHGSAYKNYNFSILSGIVYFSYHLDPKTGHYSNIHSWKTTALVDSAKANDCKVYLSVSNFGHKNNHTFLTNQTAQQKLVKNLHELLKLRNADGVVLDFESVAGEDRELFTKFLQTFSLQLKQYNPKYKCILCLYAMDYHKVFSIVDIDPFIDTYILMGYDYYGSFSNTSGPVAPLNDFI
ncbi:MAG: glycosyl hydrolase family 18 protein, partial [Bacteroidales bacterium]|nr:glycosyl hydrolase family 18 protein [Bacteroidales bacterium]